MRKLAHIETIRKIKEIPEADKIEVAVVLGWECVVKKGDFKKGDRIIYIEIDSIVPDDDPQFSFLKTRGYKVKTIALRGQISQGLVMPLRDDMSKLAIGTDVTEKLRITKIEEPDAVDGRKPLFRYVDMFRWPQHVEKTDEERIQNMPDILEKYGKSIVYITEKVDGQSVTFTTVRRKLFSFLPFTRNVFTVCGRKRVTFNKKDLYNKVAYKYNISSILKKNPHITIQGEQANQKVQGNIYGLKQPTLWVFNVIDHERNYLFNYHEMKLFCNKYGLATVPLLDIDIPLSKIGTTVEDVLDYAEGHSKINPSVLREGIVVRCVERGKKEFSFKAVSQKFLLKKEKNDKNK
jgi:RNA ligase (TIGR02306 family)